MICNSKSKKCCWGIVSENVVELFRNLCFWIVFSINSLDFLESHCNGNRSFWPRPWHSDMDCFSLSREMALFAFQPVFFFTKLKTCPSVHSYTYNNAYIITFRLWPKQPKTEMTPSENWPKWPTYQVRNDPPPKFGPTSFFHSFEIRIIECEHNRNHMITSCVFSWAFGTFLFQSLFQMSFCMDFR